MRSPIEPRNACPTLAEPMRTGDGWLARLPPLAASLSPRQLAGLADAALRHGNGLVEISKRGNWQIRGLADAENGMALARDLTALGLVLPEGVPISTDPLSDLASAMPGDAERLVDAIHRAILNSGLAARLAPKVSLIVDLGNPRGLDAVSADLRLRVEEGRVHFGIGGDDRSARWLGAVAPGDAIAAAIAVLAALAKFGPAARAARLRDRPEFDGAIDGMRIDTAPPPCRPSPEPLARQADGPERSIRGIAFPFGQIEAGALAELAGIATSLDIAAVAAAPDRILLLAGAPQAVDTVAREAARLGFLVDPADPRRLVSACIGSAGCRSGTIPSRAIAERIARAAPNLLDGSIALHISGCPKGCAHPGPAPLTFAGVDKGASLVLEGRASDPGFGFAPSDTLPDRLMRLAEAIERRKRPGETTRSALDAMGRTAIETILTEPKRDGSAENGAKPRLSA